MILADKIVSLRKKSGWSQEELAEKLGVSRQAVSKWEGAQSVPDLDRILQMSRAFGVTTDYLVKDELGEPEYTKDDEETQPPVRRVSLEEANAYLAAKEKTAKPTAWAVFLCIVSPVCLVLLSAAAEAGRLALTEDSAALIGLCVLFGLIAGAVAIFISCDEQMKRFAHLESECFETEYGVTGMVRERQSRFAPTAAKYNILGVVLCILSVVPLFLCSILPNDDFLSAVGVGLLLCCIGLGTVLLVLAGERTASFCRRATTQAEKRNRPPKAFCRPSTGRASRRPSSPTASLPPTGAGAGLSGRSRACSPPRSTPSRAQ